MIESTRNFLTEVLRGKGFDPGVVYRLDQLARNGKTAISINGEISRFFRN
jgi:hypothetical protein